MEVMPGYIVEWKNRVCCALICVAVIFSGYRPVVQKPEEIILHDEPLSFTPREFYIANLIDERENRTAVAWLLPAKHAGKNGSEPVAIDLHGGGFAAIKRFVDHNLPRNAALRPVIIKLKKCMVTETASVGGGVEGHIGLVMSFDLKGDKDTPNEGPHLADYNGSVVYTRAPGQQPQDIEPTLRHLLESALLYLNTWMNREAGGNIKLAKGVEVAFADYTEKPEGDSIYYSANRPLTWADFQSKIASDLYDAEVFPTIGYDERSEVSNGIIHVRLLMKVCLPKSACWVKDGSRNDYILNHEQRHFDIAEISALHFEQKIAAETLTTDNYEGTINVEYLEAYRELNRLQKAYDTETRHGSDHAAQRQWNDRIDKELTAAGYRR
jgi:hypothetical protein